MLEIRIHFFSYREFSRPTWKKSYHLKCQFPPKIRIRNEKYASLNLSKEPNFIFTFLVKSYITFIGPNFIRQVAQKTTLAWFQFFSQSHSSSVTWHYVTHTVWHYRPKDPRNGLLKFPTWGMWRWGCDIVTCHTIVWWSG